MSRRSDGDNAPADSSRWQGHDFIDSGARERYWSNRDADDDTPSDLQPPAGLSPIPHAPPQSGHSSLIDVAVGHERAQAAGYFFSPSRTTSTPRKRQLISPSPTRWRQQQQYNSGGNDRHEQKYDEDGLVASNHRNRVPQPSSSERPLEASTRRQKWPDHVSVEREDSNEDQASRLRSSRMAVRHPRHSSAQSRRYRAAAAHHTHASPSRSTTETDEEAASLVGDDSDDEDIPMPPEVPPPRSKLKYSRRVAVSCSASEVSDDEEDDVVSVVCQRCSHVIQLSSKLFQLYKREERWHGYAPRPHCPSCGARIAAMSTSDTEEEGRDGSRRSAWRRDKRISPQRKEQRAPLDRYRPRGDNKEEVIIPTRDEEEENYSTSDDRRQPLRHDHRASVREKTTSRKLGADATVNEYFVPQLPYLMLDMMPQLSPSSAKQGSSSPRRPHEMVTPWDVSACTACCLQMGTCAAGVCCCCAMPCVLLSERRRLLLHEVRSRYICCAGAFPCCVPPRRLRPELYYSVSEASQRRRGPRSPAPAARIAADGFFTLQSVQGVSSPSSLVNRGNGLPFDGCYRNTRKTLTNASHFSAETPSDTTSCCGCIMCVDSTCYCDCSQRCCTTCAHPTACCLSCPLCCLGCELCCCAPCALLANRLLIRQHYRLAPDPTLDTGAECCYTCCLQCLLCQPCCASGASAVPSHAAVQLGKGKSPPVTPSVLASTSCCGPMAMTIAASLAAVCCLLPCASCAMAQQRDQIERRGYPQYVEISPGNIDMY